jgi:selenocysteine lyase/cysteine desulfurase
MKKVNWTKIRKLFPATEKYTFLNAAGGSPLPLSAANAGKDFYHESLMHGDAYWENWLKRVDDTRKKLAKFIHADTKEIAFILNTSHGMNLIADILKGKGEILTMNDEFPSSTFPWMHKGFKVKFVKPEKNIYTIENIEKHITKSTKIVISSYVQYRTGFRQDLEKLGKFLKKRNIIFIVNATQAMGALPIDVKKSNIDFLTFSCFKWTLSGYGIGGLYINKKWLKKTNIPQAGWLSVKNPENMDNKHIHLRNEASAIEVGCGHFPNIFALGGALDLLIKIGKKNIQNRILELDTYLEGKLTELNLKTITPLDKKYRSGITIVKIKNAKTIVEKLAKYKVMVAARGEGIRVSVHIYNNEQDIDKFSKVIKKLLRL